MGGNPCLGESLNGRKIKKNEEREGDWDWVRERGDRVSGGKGEEERQSIKIYVKYIEYM